MSAAPDHVQHPYDKPTHNITPGVPRDQNIEHDPKNTNRAKKVAPMPESCGKSLKDGVHSGGGSAGHRTFGSGKGPLEHENKLSSAEKGKGRQ
ncbi:Protein of unknown function [Pyronema omphalodes CBS 100304]|uniref:Uncharacterized protein n=1 Tax=Pyronema omphalodes (strain CBS 100304) TaxID=1076935 RepID=U4LE45_PYROM|nr:Protein of unknown function [Pyronema omphalodes CBS 100304]